jgi:FAD/FMN-containing dehydrogenase
MIESETYIFRCKGIPAPQVNCEIAIPMEKLSAALIKLRKYYHESGKDMHYPFILRATGSSDAWLSPSYGRSVCFIGFLVYLSEDFQGNEERLQMLRDVEEVLAEFDALPHYGKFFTRSLYPLEKRLPKYNDFKAFRAQVDPEGVFMNSFLESLLI